MGEPGVGSARVCQCVVSLQPEAGSRKPDRGNISAHDWEAIKAAWSIHQGLQEMLMSLLCFSWLPWCCVWLCPCGACYLHPPEPSSSSPHPLFLFIFSPPFSVYTCEVTLGSLLCRRWNIMSPSSISIGGVHYSFTFRERGVAGERACFPFYRTGSEPNQSSLTVLPEKTNGNSSSPNCCNVERPTPVATLLG